MIPLLLLVSISSALPVQNTAPSTTYTDHTEHSAQVEGFNQQLNSNLADVTSAKYDRRSTPTRAPTASPTTAPTALATTKTTLNTNPASEDSSVDLVNVVMMLLATVVAIAAVASLALYIFLQCRQQSEAVEVEEIAQAKLTDLFSFDISEPFTEQMPGHLIKSQTFECIINPKSDEDVAAMESKVAEDDEAKLRRLGKLTAERAAADDAVNATKAEYQALKDKRFKQFLARDDNGNQQFKTPTIDGDLNPTYDQLFEFDSNVAQRTTGSPYESTLVLEVWDEDALADNLMGRCSVPLCKLEEGENQSFQLRDESGDAGDASDGKSEFGTINISVKRRVTEEAASRAVEAAEAEAAEVLEPEQHLEVLSVTVLSCCDLKNLDLLGESDPYVVVTLKQPRNMNVQTEESTNAEGAAGADAETAEDLAKVVEMYEKGLLSDEEFVVAKKKALAIDTEASADADEPRSPSEDADATIEAAKAAYKSAKKNQKALAKALEKEENPGPRKEPKPPIGSPIRPWKPAKVRTPLSLKPVRSNRDPWDDE